MFGLENIAPKFIVPSKKIKVLYEPSEFYSYLCNRIRAAQSRVFLASLYLGTAEKDLINVLSDAMQKNKDLRLYVLVDGLRGTREAPQPCSASLLAPLAAQFPSRVRLSLYQSPKLGWLTSKLLPKRIIEGVGLQHMKLYGFDDEILLSGANLSQDYFTNRQDRYISIRDRSLTNWFFNMHTAVSDLSCNLLHAHNAQGFELELPSSHQRRAARQRIRDMLRPTNARAPAEVSSVEPTVTVFPVAQLTPFKIGNELEAMQTVINAAKKSDYNWMLTAGYFNIDPKLANSLATASNGSVIVASQQANGFYKSKGISGTLPHYYSILTRDFLKKVPPSNYIDVREWQRGVVNTPEGWSYHAKGLWLWKNPKTVRVDGATPNDHGEHKNDVKTASTGNLPFLTYIGSSNFTRRSYRHDLECGAILIENGGEKEGSSSLINDIIESDVDGPTNRYSPSEGSTHIRKSDSNARLGIQLQKEINNLHAHCKLQLTLQNCNARASLKERLLLLLIGDRL